jgi:peroxiredoxin
VSLKQPLEYKLTLEDAVKRVAATGQLGTYGLLPRYDPIAEFIGKKPPEFELPEAGDGIPRRSKSLIASDKVNVLIFWSIDCAHCTKFMPKFNAWLRDHREGMNVVSLAKTTNDAMKTKTAEFVKFNGFIFPTLLDKDFTVAQQYLVTGTPTIVLMRPDGVVHSIMPAGEENFDVFFAAKRKEILKKS